MQWQDQRLKQSPCAAVLPDMLSLSREEANSDIQRNVKDAYKKMYWIPKLESDNLIPGYWAQGVRAPIEPMEVATAERLVALITPAVLRTAVEEAEFALDESGFWESGLAPPVEPKRRALSASQPSPAEAHARRRAAANAELARRIAETRGDEMPPLDELRRARHSARMSRRKNWRATERRRLSEAEPDEALPEAPCSNCAICARHSDPKAPAGICELMPQQRVTPRGARRRW